MSTETNNFGNYLLLALQHDLKQENCLQCSAQSIESLGWGKWLQRSCCALAHPELLGSPRSVSCHLQQCSAVNSPISAIEWENVPRALDLASCCGSGDAAGHRGAGESSRAPRVLWIPGLAASI